VLAASSAAAWGLAAWLLLRTRVPSLDLTHVSASHFFPASELARSERFGDGLRWLWVAATVTELAALGALVWKAGPLAAAAARLGRGRIRTGMVLAAGSALAFWVAAATVGAVGHWWLRRYGLSLESYARWLAGQAIALGVLVVLVAAAVAAALALAGRFRRRWWLLFSAFLAVLGFAFAFVQPLVLVPLTERLQPLDDPALGAQIAQLASRLDVNVREVDVARVSERTTAANAEAVGVGPAGRIVLDDTLLDGRFSSREVALVAAHELGHVARWHLWKGVAWLALLVLPGGWLVSRVLGAGAAEPRSVPLGLLLAFAFFLATLPAQNAISRRYEAEADWLALVATRDPASAVAAERSFAAVDLIDPDPPGWARVLIATHPSPLERIAMACAFARQHGVRPGAAGCGSARDATRG
jgi:STE24 endopeptidase